MLQRLLLPIIKLKFFIEIFGARCVTDIKPEDIEDALDKLAQRGKIKVLTTRNGL